ncbi:MAG: sulfatase-like hydrolase/transferase, partial [Oscillospiraceae bacterium]|nr:sulfatase-like hydrolase/transferase [Oscillospiraceae bacterium]
FLLPSMADVCPYSKYINNKYPDEKFDYFRDKQYSPYPEEDFYDRWTVDRAIVFIESYSKTGQAPNGATPENENAPVYLFCSLNSPHGPLTPPKEVSGVVDEEKIPDVLIQERPDEDIPTVELYRRAFLNPVEVVRDPHIADEERKQERVLYCELIAEVDALVGRLVKSLKDNGIYENTTIIFSSDHGSCENDYNVMTKGPWPYKPQLFIPMIISNHPALEKGTRCDALCGNLDIGATVLDIAGDDKAFGLSRSMIGLATGKVAEREVNMSEFCDSSKTLVDKRYTFTYYPFTNKTCLFDRINDPQEKVNLGGRNEYREIEYKFMMHLVDFMIICKGVRIEAHDLTKDIYEGIAKKSPKFLDNFDIAYPIGSWDGIERLEKLGLDATYNEFCRDREIKAHYGVYFHQERPKKQ